nr:MAG TPA: hypothetical protein [Bacteriophage sp.]
MSFPSFPLIYKTYLFFRIIISITTAPSRASRQLVVA